MWCPSSPVYCVHFSCLRLSRSNHPLLLPWARLPSSESLSLSLSLSLSHTHTHTHTHCRVRDLERENSELKSQLQQAHLTYHPTSTSAGAICCDSSGPVTSAAVYHLRGEVKKLKEEKEKLETRVKKLKNALIENKELYEQEQ